MNIPRTMFSVQPVAGGEPLWLPNPNTDSAEGLIATLVNSARNASGIVTAQKIGRDQDKTTLKWTYLDKDVWEELLQFFDTNFFFKFSYYSPVKQARIMRTFYVSDRTYKPFAVDVKGIPTAYKDCSLNVVDTGEGS